VKHSLSPDDHVPHETRRALDRYIALLVRWNHTVNLVARADEPTLRDRHIADSLQLVPLMVPRPERGIDLGSGAGLPGLVLSLVTGVAFDLVEADHRKAAFLREAARITGASVQVHPVRIEEARLAPAPLITARAVAPLPRLLELAEPLLAPGGMCLFLKGAGVDAELTQIGTEWHMELDRIPSRTAPGATILRITGLTRVPHPN
jgi:16S rRNA (guanine527-N7)-methyltransferase